MLFACLSLLAAPFFVVAGGVCCGGLAELLVGGCKLFSQLVKRNDYALIPYYINAILLFHFACQYVYFYTRLFITLKTAHFYYVPSNDKDSEEMELPAVQPATPATPLRRRPTTTVPASSKTDSANKTTASPVSATTPLATKPVTSIEHKAYKGEFSGISLQEDLSTPEPGREPDNTQRSKDERLIH